MASRLDLGKLFREPSERHKPLAERTLTRDFSAEYTPLTGVSLKKERVVCEGRFIRLKAYLEQKLRGVPLVNLGAGRESNTDDTSYNRYVKTFKPAEYIRVDKFFKVPDGVIDIRDEIKGMIECIWKDETAPRITNVKSDMLLFAENLPEGSANFILSGIDSCIIPSPEYHQALAQELERKIPIGGIIIGANSEALKYIHMSDKFRRVFSSSHLDDPKQFERYDEVIYERIA